MAQSMACYADDTNKLNHESPAPDQKWKHPSYRSILGLFSYVEKVLHMAGGLQKPLVTAWYVLPANGIHDACVLSVHAQI